MFWPFWHILLHLTRPKTSKSQTPLAPQWQLRHGAKEGSVLICINLSGYETVPEQGQESCWGSDCENFEDICLLLSVTIACHSDKKCCKVTPVFVSKRNLLHVTPPRPLCPQRVKKANPFSCRKSRSLGTLLRGKTSVGRENKALPHMSTTITKDLLCSFWFCEKKRKVGRTDWRRHDEETLKSIHCSLRMQLATAWFLNPNGCWLMLQMLFKWIKFAVKTPHSLKVENTDFWIAHAKTIKWIPINQFKSQNNRQHSPVCRKEHEAQVDDHHVLFAEIWKSTIFQWWRGAVKEITKLKSNSTCLTTESWICDQNWTFNWNWLLDSKTCCLSMWMIFNALHSIHCKLAQHPSKWNWFPSKHAQWPPLICPTFALTRHSAPPCDCTVCAHQKRLLRQGIFFMWPWLQFASARTVQWCVW